MYSEPFLNFTTPVVDKAWAKCINYKYEQQYPKQLVDGDSSCIIDNFSNETESCQAGHVFDKSTFKSSTITDVRI